MIRLIVGLIFILFSSQTSADNAVSSIVGGWEFYKVYYEGRYRPPFSKNLKIFFDFTLEGESRLYYERLNEEGYCERVGEYQVENDEFLIDTVVWVNPKNNSECSLDPDMRLGNQTTTKFEIKEGDLHLYLYLSGQPLIYIWKRISP